MGKKKLIIDKINNEKWNILLNTFNDFVIQNGRYPSSESKNEDEKKLGRWVSCQRTAYKNGTLKKDREVSLNEIGFKWYEHVFEDWEESRDKLNLFISEHGRYPSRESENKEEKKLGRWVQAQRQVYRTRKISKEREGKLRAMGFIWDPLEEEWENNYNALKQHLEENAGRYPSAISKNEDEKRLGVWVQNQRRAVKNGKMSLVRYKALSKIKFVFDTKEEKNLAKANEQFFKEADQEWSR